MEHDEDERTVREIHMEAMRYFQDAYVEKITNGKTSAWHQDMIKAFELEKEAANRFEAIPTNEPTRSILWRSVASISLALEIDYAAYRAAERGLEGSPPPKEERFLRAILEGELRSDNLNNWKG